jgi:hypothetical protein
MPFTLDDVNRRCWRDVADDDDWWWLKGRMLIGCMVDDDGWWVL